MRSIIFLITLFSWLVSFAGVNTIGESHSTSYYFDSKNGSDENTGYSPRSPWKTLFPLARIQLKAGDSIRFRRGSSFIGPVEIPWSGVEGKYIIVTSYGPRNEPAPSFTNPVFTEGNYGNCIRVLGSYIIIENLYCHHTAAYTPINYKGAGWDVWEMGAIHIGSPARHCIVRNNEINDCVAGIRSNGEYTIIEHNYIHDCNRVLKQWTWGPIGIWLGKDYQEVRYNRVFNYSVVDPRINWGPNSYGGGADGGAMEIDDARFPKSHISIHHNYTRDCQGFLEVTWNDVQKNPTYSGFQIHHNISDDYQQFIALWRGEGCHIENNTIIRRKVNANDIGVFNITQKDGRNYIRNNIVVVEKNIMIFNLGRLGKARPLDSISHNLYFAASGELKIGLEGPGDSAVFGDPKFKNYNKGSGSSDFEIPGNSAAKDKGLNLGYQRDFVNTIIPQGTAPDLGAFEYKQ